ncbi:N-acetyllactosaminide beta-1,3-N-acetylglucosaminyltransferase 2 [Trematomus bernacchii]|uniref:N-acetyllactosaminide beta-1,3-N-acetylglucosaminyltransferase 2 n=1 Tax=Trematomus bernacchii TaxID=40690 RepID=UPI00146BF640|nr:N-acetyllactosaminide beta-1,3-N-acetylglucosaminyltransferase 2 [Trematomus bernacchii]
MARCFCRWRRVLICVCTPLISLALLLFLIMVMLCTAMQSGIPNPHFVAPGYLKNESLAPFPKTFWVTSLHGQAIWNRLQLTNDRRFNPILHPKKLTRRFENGNFEAILKNVYSEVTDSNTNYDKLPQQIQDFVSHMQRRDYPLLLQPDGVCGAGAQDEKEPPLLLLAIKSTELNFKNRHVIRQTWGQGGWVAGRKRNSNGGGYVRRVFLLGKENTEELGVDLSEILQMESKLHGDILQWDFSDTFFNLTLKDVLFWSWFSSSCGQTSFVFKGDDDVFVNTPNMLSYLKGELKKPQAHESMKDFMVGDVIIRALPNRVKKSKYYVPESFYKGQYPLYAGGGGVVYSGLLAKRLHDVSKRVHLFPIDDVYVGMCMARLNAGPVHHPAFLTFDFTGNDEDQLCSYHGILLVHRRLPNQVLKLWANMKNTEAQCWGVPLRGGTRRNTTL